MQNNIKIKFTVKELTKATFNLDFTKKEWQEWTDEWTQHCSAELKIMSNFDKFKTMDELDIDFEIIK
jgi:hypothetical protein